MGRTIPFFLTANHCKNGLGDAIGYATLLYYIPVIPCFAGEQSRGELNYRHWQLTYDQPSSRLIVKKH